ncbi:MAG: 50S ribosomal protein L19 [Alphaproteobacteria bacterium]|nr:50S ribosomal protein L19 [Alphaproteobacteria bacterium]MBN2779883.1 50S ribosomal protein L19 [Alphaproteobacteria bacterium]
MNVLRLFEKKKIEEAGKDIPNFKAGDTLKVHTKIKEGKNERIQIYEGVCIARKNNGMGSTFTVRKISFNEGVERIFPLYSPNIEKIEKVRIGKVRRAKLYYMRVLRGRKARIVEDIAKAQKERNEAKK